MALGPQAKEYEVFSRTAYDLPPNLSAVSSGTDELVAKAIDVMVDGGIVGIFRGRSEFGPRALCNRTLLALPSINGISSTLNYRLQRSDFMPFAPVIASDFAQYCLKEWSKHDINSLYMTQTFDCTSDFKNSCPEVVHLDGTARPQVVWSERDPFMHCLLLEVHRRTGSFSLINTSFDVHESPIVGSLETAIDAVRDGVCDLLLVNDRYSVSSKTEAHKSRSAA